MTKGEALSILAAAPQEELGDILMQLAATYWLEECEGNKDEVMFLFEETLEESHGN